MRVSIVTALVAGIMLVLVAAAFADGRTATYSEAGLTITVPAGWHVVHERLTPCTNPLERVTLSGHGALVTLMETLDPRRYVRRYLPRPRRFALRGEPQWIACCAPLNRRGWFFDFRDHGRGFYVYAYLGQAGTRGEALAALDSIHIRPR